MQQLLPCTHCGAEIPTDARFCRNCGQRSKQLDRPSVTEGTTRILETPGRPDPFNQEVYEQSSLAQATNQLPPQVTQTSRELATKDKGSQWLLIGSLVVSALLLTTLLIVLLTRSSKTVTITPPVVRGPEIPSAPIAPAPPLPPQGIPQGGTINPAYIYPGARTTMTVKNPAEGDMLQLQTADSFDKVVDWYTEKLKPTSFVKQQDEHSQSVVLGTKDLAVIITANDAGTSIMLTQGDRD